MKPKVSVIITTFKRPQFLRHAMESVLNQNFKDFELIVVNDDPAGVEVDGIISLLGDPRIVYIRNRENLGQPRSLALGLMKSQGDYVAILDDDDVWLTGDKLDRQAAFLDGNPGHVLVGTNVIVVNGSTQKEIVRTNFPAGDEDLRRLLFGANPFAQSSVMFRREAALSVGGYDGNLPRAEDYDLWLKLAKVGKTAVLPEYFLRYREGAFKERDLTRQRYEDAKWTLIIMRRHRRDFSSTFLPCLKQWLRYLIFRVLIEVPIVYRVFKAIKG